MPTDNDITLSKEILNMNSTQIYNILLRNRSKKEYRQSIEKSNVTSGVSSYMKHKISVMKEIADFFSKEAILDGASLSDVIQSDPVAKLTLIQEMLNNGALRAIGRDIIVDSAWVPNDFLVRQLLLRQGVYSGQTALYLWELSDQFPYKVYMTFRRGYKLPKSLDKWSGNVVVRQGNTKTLDEFVCSMDVSGTKRQIKLYSKERALVEILRDATNKEIVNAAYKRYLNSKDRNVGRLLLTASKLGSLGMVKDRLEIML